MRSCSCLRLRLRRGPRLRKLFGRWPALRCAHGHGTAQSLPSSDRGLVGLMDFIVVGLHRRQAFGLCAVGRGRRKSRLLMRPSKKEGTEPQGWASESAQIAGPGVLEGTCGVVVWNWEATRRLLAAASVRLRHKEPDVIGWNQNLEYQVQKSKLGKPKFWQLFGLLSDFFF